MLLIELEPGCINHRLGCITRLIFDFDFEAKLISGRELIGIELSWLAIIFMGRVKFIDALICLVLGKAHRHA
ncbi:MAG: hypothetical protein AAF212_06580 [Verrucomicrobiota bacterium]